MSQAIEQVVQGRTAVPQPAAHGRPAVRAAAMLAAALSLTVVGMALAYAVVRLFES